jgi:hypothetical protein
MRQSEGLPPDPEMLAELETIDLTLAGLAIDPAYAEIAELTLLTAAERPRMTPAFAAELDARVQRRFAPDPAPDSAPDSAPAPAAAARGGGLGRRRGWGRRGGARELRGGRLGSLLRTPAFGAGLATVLAATALAVVVVDHTAGPSAPSTITNQVPLTSPGPVSAASGGVPRKSAGGTSHSSSFGSSSPAKSLAAVPSPAAQNGAAAQSGAAGQSGAAATGAPAPVPNGRRQVQSAQLQLTASNAHFNAVSQEVFDVVGQENGIVKSSSVTGAAGNQSYASFSLSIPSQNLQATMTRLSALRYASVASRTDATQDVNDRYLNDQRKLADAQALHASLLKQLATAVTEAEIVSFTAQIHEAEASISSDEATLARLQSHISFSSLTVQINAAQVIVHPLPAGSKHSGFTIGKAGHDSVRVLTVAAGVALIAFAALIPFALLAALIAWIAYWVRRRRREQALDAA